MAEVVSEESSWPIRLWALELREVKPESEALGVRQTGVVLKKNLNNDRLAQLQLKSGEISVNVVTLG